MITVKPKQLSQAITDLKQSVRPKAQGWISWLVLIGLLVGIYGQPTVYGLDYQPGLQEAFPFYVPEAYNQEAVIPTVYQNSLRGSTNSESVYSFGLDWLGLTGPQAASLTGTIAVISATNPGFSNNQRCHLAGWLCGGQRRQALIDFNDHRGLGGRASLANQLFFIAFELTDRFNPAGGSLTGGYQRASLELLQQIDTVGNSDAIKAFVGSYIEAGDQIDNAVLTTIVSRSIEIYGRYRSLAAQPRTPTDIEIINNLDLNQSAIKHTCTNNNRRPGQYNQDRDNVAVEVVGTTNRRIIVQRCLAAATRALLASLNTYLLSVGQGLVSGGGWRSHETQIMLRRNHCGTSDFDIWQKRASQCRPPTAIPGRSNHEYGLAIDFFKIDSTSILTRNDTAFVWLQGNAHLFGFKNLPSEAWHWSFNGG